MHRRVLSDGAVCSVGLLQFIWGSVPDACIIPQIHRKRKVRKNAVSGTVSHFTAYAHDISGFLTFSIYVIKRNIISK